MRKIKRPNVRAVRPGPPLVCLYLDMLSDRVSLSHEGDVLPPPLSGGDWSLAGTDGLTTLQTSDWTVSTLSRVTLHSLLSPTAGIKHFQSQSNSSLGFSEQSW